jgi:excisionase family DNA binding protein
MSAEIMAEEKFYTVSEVAVMLRITVQTIRRMIKEGELPAFRIRGEWRIRQSAIDEFIRKNEKR